MRTPRFYITNDGEHIINLDRVEIIHLYQDNDYPMPYILEFHMASGKKVFAHFETEQERIEELKKINYVY